MNLKVVKFYPLIIHKTISKISLFIIIKYGFPHIPKYNYNKFLYIR